MRYLALETDLFFTGIPDDQLGHWFIGADCAGWFYARLLPTPEIKQHLDPTMEDWGWIMAVETAETVVDICVWEYLGMEQHWVLGIGAKKKFLKKTEPDRLASALATVESALTAIVGSDTRFPKFKWFDNNPMEMPIDSLD